MEAGVLPEHQQAFKVPYEDMTPYMGMNKQEILKEGGLKLIRQVDSCKNGKWRRYYQFHQGDRFEQDLEFTYQLFRKIGFEVTRQQIDRYVVLTWG